MAERTDQHNSVDRSGYPYNFGALLAAVGITLDRMQTRIAADTPITPDAAREIAGYLRQVVDECRQRVGMKLPDPQCSICRTYHPNDDRHPCE